ncbi:fumarylacetoacetate hydrolase family protein [Candidatus Poriferisodalis sp.]|uniref:fumarylacetoacetate hydrolase family protein n=1 Tax=Candidatus Poriferisodalis sp. TaxID=3101277 RepID=UPI003B51BBAF
MRWVTYRAADSSERTGLVRDGSIYGLDNETALIDLLGDDGSELANAAERAERDPFEVIDLGAADLAPPIRPPQVRDFLCFLDHLRNAQDAAGIDLDPLWEQIPAFYFSNTSSVIGPNDPVEISPDCVWFDYELEVAAIIGRGGQDIHPDEAESHIAGFMIFCDWSARDLQMREMKLSLGPSKGKDGANTFGPMLVTADELEPFRSGNSYHLEMTAYVNGEQISHGWMDQMDWSFGEIIAYASRGTALRPGEAICSGTVPTGCLFEHFAVQGPDDFPGWLVPGDEVRLEVQELGTCSQAILPAVEVHRLHTGI